MKVLMVNKFLFRNGGSETYIFEIGKQLRRMGHEVEYFGMEHKEQIAGNRAGSYTANMDFHNGGFRKLLYPFRIIYSREARKKIRIVLEDLNPDVVHLNNFNYQLTPSIIYEIRKWERKAGKRISIIYTAHDYQWICPNHMMMIPATGELCFRCKGSNYFQCTKNKCIHGSRIRSLLGTAEAELYHFLKTYQLIDRIICPSRFMAEKLGTNPLLVEKLEIIYNFINEERYLATEKKDYVLYFGRFSEEKGVNTLLKVCGGLKQIPFVFAGSGPLKNEIEKYPNITNLGFLSGEALKKVIAEARFVVFPSEWYENCPFSVMEAQWYGTPVIASDIGGVPELLKDGITGELFCAGKEEELRERIERLWKDREQLNLYTKNCVNISFLSVEVYCKKLLQIYGSTN